LGLKSKVLPGPLTNLSAWVEICTSFPQQGVKYQLWYLDCVGDPINIPWNIAEGRQSSFPLGISIKGIARALNDLMLKSCSEMPGSWGIPCSKNSNVIPGISVLIGHASRPP
jgi:hypothetical protein